MKRFSLLLSLTSILFFPLSAEAQPAESTHSTTEEIGRIPLGKAPSKKEAHKIAKSRKKIAHSHKKEKKHSSSSKKEKTKGCGLWNSSYIQPVYRIKGIGASGRTLTFDNETIWEISDSSSSTVRTWSIGSYVVITPNSSWFSSYTYRLENLSDNRSTATANLSEGPFKKYATFINAIDRINNIVSLTDGSLWSIATDSSSLSLFRTWRVGQAVLLGEGRGWFGWPNGNIILNINENQYVPAQSY